MKKKMFLLTGCLLAISGVYAQTTPVFVDTISTDRDEYLVFQTADKELNTLCQQVIKSRMTDTVFVRNFRTAQKLWVQLRDAELRMLYPDVDKVSPGITQSACWSQVMEELTKERTAKLTALLAGEKGLPCTDTVK